MKHVLANLMFILCAGTADASVTYQYVGNPYSLFANVGPYVANTTFQFTVDTPIAPSSTYAIVGTGWSADAGGTLFVPTSNSTVYFFSLQKNTVTTDALGNIAQWSIQATYSLQNAGPVSRTAVLSFQDSGSIDFGGFIGLDGLTSVGRVGLSSSQYQEGTTVAGAWTTLSSAVPEPSTIALAGLGLAHLAWVKRRRSSAGRTGQRRSAAKACTTCRPAESFDAGFMSR